MRIFNTILLGIIGFISGALSALATDVAINYYVWPNAIWYVPGIVFGVLVSFAMLMRRDREATLVLRLPLWIVASTASYFVAVKTVELLIQNSGTSPSYGEFLIAGAVGGLLMLFSFSILLHGLELKELGVLTVLGAVLGLAWFAGTANSSLWYEGPLFALCVIWQTGMALGLGIALDRRG